MTLRAEGVTKRFGGLAAVDDVSLSIEPGSVTGLIGPNGAGKSTMFNLVTRVLEVTEGRLYVGDVEITGSSPVEVAGMGVARTFQTPRGFESLSVIENVEVMLHTRREAFFGALFGSSRGDRQIRADAVEALAKVGLEGRADDRYSNLSSGEHRLLEIARQLVRRPTVLLLDEPTAGVHPTLQGRLRDLLFELNRDGVTVLLVEHNLGFLMSVASYIHVMALGRLLASGPTAEIAKDPVVIEAYLGQPAEPEAESEASPPVGSLEPRSTPPLESTEEVSPDAARCP